MYAVAPLKQVGRGLKQALVLGQKRIVKVAPLKQVGRGLKLKVLYVS